MDCIEYARRCVATGDLHAFYTCSEWLRVRAEILAGDKYECQYCKQAHVYTRATIVHHVNHLRRRPDLAFAKHYTDGAGWEHRQLVSCCDRCHAIQHPERMGRHKPKRPVTEERW